MSSKSSVDEYNVTTQAKTCSHLFADDRENVLTTQNFLLSVLVVVVIHAAWFLALLRGHTTYVLVPCGMMFAFYMSSHANESHLVYQNLESEFIETRCCRCSCHSNLSLEMRNKKTKEPIKKDTITAVGANDNKVLF